MFQPPKIRALIQELQDVLNYLLDQEAAHKEQIEAVAPHLRDSAVNLVHYLALRTFNLRTLQADLSQLGLSSIGASERYTMANIVNILHLLHLLAGEHWGETDPIEHYPANYETSRELLEAHTTHLFGPSKEVPNRIMVTMPTEAADNVALIEQLLRSGMGVARINCSHDNEEVWLQIIQNIRATAAKLGTHCHIYMDLAGPKLRTGPVAKKIKKKKKIIDYITLFPGEELALYRTPIEGRDAERKANGELIRPAGISVSLPSIFDHLELGHPIWFDDGKIGAKVVQIKADHALLKIVQANPQKGSRLRSEKGINLPQTRLDLPALTSDDLACLPFIAQHADVVGYSFVRYPADVKYLEDSLANLGRPDIGIVLKIETQTAFENLPNLLLTGMQNPSIGVMLARGDLAVEIGWERISEVQEQILWLCEAAHVPVIWATQVLESLAKTGTASRAEITDAAMAGRSECVMLNKGPYIVEALQTLHNILNRMQFHTDKKKGRLRALEVARRFCQG